MALFQGLGALDCLVMKGMVGHCFIPFNSALFPLTLIKSIKEITPLSCFRERILSFPICKVEIVALILFLYFPVYASQHSSFFSPLSWLLQLLSSVEPHHRCLSYRPSVGCLSPDVLPDRHRSLKEELEPGVTAIVQGLWSVV